MTTKERMIHDASWYVEVLCFKCGVGWAFHTDLICRETKARQLQEFSTQEFYPEDGDDQQESFSATK